MSGSLYCKQHDPSVIAAKRAARQAQWEVKWAAEKAEGERQAAIPRKARELAEAVNTAFTERQTVTNWNTMVAMARELLALLDGAK